MPTDPRAATGVCENSSPWNPPLQAWQTGGAGAGNIPTSVSASLAWPPASLSNGGAITLLPSYTPTGPLMTLPVPTFTAASATSTISAGSGWENNGDTAGMMVQIPSCSYLNPWVGPTAAPPSPLCAGAPQITPAVSTGP
jgi:glucan 1,3-beta-glucosidase